MLEDKPIKTTESTIHSKHGLTLKEEKLFVNLTLKLIVLAVLQGMWTLQNILETYSCSLIELFVRGKANIGFRICSFPAQRCTQAAAFRGFFTEHKE